jgi:hypothetical protein
MQGRAFRNSIPNKLKRPNKNRNENNDYYYDIDDNNNSINNNNIDYIDRVLAKERYTNTTNNNNMTTMNHLHNPKMMIPLSTSLNKLKERSSVNFHQWLQNQSPPRQQRQQRQRQRHPPGREEIEMTFNPSRFDNLLLPTPIIVMGFPVSFLFVFFLLIVINIMMLFDLVI